MRRVREGERAALDRLPSDDVAPNFYLVQPGTAGQGEMEGDTSILGEPGSRFQFSIHDLIVLMSTRSKGVHVVPFVCRQVAQENVKLALAVSDDSVDAVEELRGAPPRTALPEHLTGCGVPGRGTGGEVVHDGLQLRPVGLEWPTGAVDG
jgi:hypothetical protein